MRTQIENTARRALTVAALFGASILSSCDKGDEPKPVDPANPKPTELKNGDKLEYTQIRLREDMTFRGQFYAAGVDLADGRKLDLGSGGGPFANMKAQEQTSALVNKEDIVAENAGAITFKADEADGFVMTKDGITVYLLPKKDGTSTVMYGDNNIPKPLTEETRVSLVDRFNGLVKDALPEKDFSYRLLLN